MSNPGVLLVNLGSPDSPSVKDVRRYLRQFLMDERVIDMAFIPRFLLVHGCILPFRPRQSAEAYHKIWWPEGSPLVVISQRVCAQLQKRLTVPVELAMRYQNPSIGSALRRLAQRRVDELLLVPLFPHYAMSSVETAVEEVKALSAKIGILCQPRNRSLTLAALIGARPGGHPGGHPGEAGGFWQRHRIPRSATYSSCGGSKESSRFGSLAKRLSTFTISPVRKPARSRRR